MSLGNTVLGATETAIHTGEIKDDVVLSITFCNVKATSVWFTLHAYKAGSGPAGDGNRVIKRKLGPEDSYVWTSTEKFIMDAGDVVSAIASEADAVTATKVYVR